MAYGPVDKDQEIRIPRHDKAEHQVPVEPSALGMNSHPKVPFSSTSINPPGVYEWYFFVVELQTALTAGLPFVRAIGLVASDSHQRTIRRAGNMILAQLKRSSGAKAIMQASAIPPLIRQMLVVGLRGGDAGGALRQVVRHYSWLLEIRGFVLRVIAYPSILVILGTAVMIMRDTAIATLTGGMSTGEAAIEAIIRYGLPVLAGASLAVVVAWLIYMPGFRSAFDRIVVTAPVLGKLIRQYSQAIFFRTLAHLIEAGMPITDGWIQAGTVIPNAYLAKRLEHGLRFLQDGESLEEAIRQTRTMDVSSQAMAAIGEAAGSIPGSLRKYADYREMELRSTVKMMTSLLGLPCIAFIALGYFHSPAWLAVLVFILVFIRRAI